MGLWDKILDLFRPPELQPKRMRPPHLTPNPLADFFIEDYGLLKVDHSKRDRVFTEKCYRLVEEAERWIGTREEGGSNQGADVERFQREVDGRANGEPWCMAFTQYCINEVDRQYEREFGFSHLMNWVYETEHCLTCFNRTPRDARTFDLHPGLIVIWQVWEGLKQTMRGHCGIIKEVTKHGEIVTIEGNTRDEKAVVREGDGVYLKTRSIKYDGDFRIRGFLKAWDGQFIF